MSQETRPSFDHLVVMHNPVAFTAYQTKRETDKLQESLHVIYVPTDPSWEVTQAALLETVSSTSSLVGVIGGDGTIRNVIKGWRKKGADKFPHIPLAFLGGGNVNDGSKALNGDSTPTEIVKTGIDSWIHPVETHLTFPDGQTETDVFFNYGGPGSVAASCEGHGELKATTNWLTRIMHVRRTREFLYTVKVAGRYPGFYIVENDDGEETFGPLRPVQDVTCLHSSRIASAGRPHTDHWQPNMEVVTSVKKGIGRAAVSMVMMGMGAMHGEMTPAISLKVRAKKGEDVPMQLDGDTRRLPNDTVIHMRLSDEPLLVRSTRASKNTAA